MLKRIQSKTFRPVEAQFAIIASQYNRRYVDAMVRAAKAELKRAGVARCRVIRVPGAYEIPVVAARLASGQFAGAARAGKAPDRGPSRLPAAIICLGVILRGETVHAAHIGEAVSQALMRIQLEYLIPVVHEVLLLENEEQARVRCLGRKHNRGVEAAQTALAMAHVMRAMGP